MSAAEARITSRRDQSELVSLGQLSARIGDDPLLAQASSGNTSIKMDGILWVKAHPLSRLKFY
jgi:rhamnose utilization protein RhaD (predicted bifunctional aldolase and dehydrogenase)